MTEVARAFGWGTAFLVLIVFAVPWFLWGSASVVAGLPVWLWWHVGWMVVASAVFYAFTRHAWDDLMGVEPGEKRAAVRADGGFGADSDIDTDVDADIGAATAVDADTEEGVDR